MNEFKVWVGFVAVVACIFALALAFDVGAEPPGQTIHIVEDGVNIYSLRLVDPVPFVREGEELSLDGHDYVVDRVKHFFSTRGNAESGGPLQRGYRLFVTKRG